MFSTMLTRPRPPVPASDQPHLLLPSFQTRRGVRRRGGMAVVVRGGAAILSPQCRPGCRRGQWPVRLRAPRPAPAPRHTGHCLLLLQRGASVTRPSSYLPCTEVSLVFRNCVVVAVAVGSESGAIESGQDLVEGGIL